MQRTERQDDSAAGEDLPRESGAHLRLVFGEPSGSLFEITNAGLELGREASGPSPAVLRDARMSRRHARIERSAMHWSLRDLGSRNGGFVDGVPFAPSAVTALREGSIVRLGDSIGVFRHGPPVGPGGLARDAFPGVSPAADAVRRRLESLAASEGHVLILGETGVGKERAARFVGSSREKEPFVAVNCAELSRELGRSELFGHAKGAFSGASTTGEGLVAKAGNGVLFLDEVGELPLETQAELLRFLEDGSYRSIGSTELKTSNARVVAATNVVLDEAVEQRTFRRDLLARLRSSNAPLELPPLRERPEDILDWVGLFVEETLAPRPSRLLAAGAAECLLLYSWPDNLRGLRGFARGLVDQAKWPVESARLPQQVRDHRRTVREVPIKTVESTAPGERPPEPNAEDIVRALEQTQGRVRAAAQLLSVERRNFYRLCERYGVAPDRFRPRNSSNDNHQ